MAFAPDLAAIRSATANSNQLSVAISETIVWAVDVQPICTRVHCASGVICFAREYSGLRAGAKVYARGGVRPLLRLESAISARLGGSAKSRFFMSRQMPSKPGKSDPCVMPMSSSSRMI